MMQQMEYLLYLFILQAMAQVVVTSVGSSDDTAGSIGVTSGRCDCFVLCV